MGRSSVISRQISNISTPRLTPLKHIDRRRGGNIISKLDIDDLENKIKAIESKIDEVKLRGEQRKLDRAEKRLEETTNR